MDSARDFNWVVVALKKKEDSVFSKEKTAQRAQ